MIGSKSCTTHTEPLFKKLLGLFPACVISKGFLSFFPKVNATSPNCFHFFLFTVHILVYSNLMQACVLFLLVMFFLFFFNNAQVASHFKPERVFHSTKLEGRLTPDSHHTLGRQMLSCCILMACDLHAWSQRWEPMNVQVLLHCNCEHSRLLAILTGAEGSSSPINLESLCFNPMV